MLDEEKRPRMSLRDPRTTSHLGRPTLMIPADGRLIRACCTQAASAYDAPTAGSRRPVLTVPLAKNSSKSRTCRIPARELRIHHSARAGRKWSSLFEFKSWLEKQGRPEMGVHPERLSVHISLSDRVALSGGRSKDRTIPSASLVPAVKHLPLVKISGPSSSLGIADISRTPAWHISARPSFSRNTTYTHPSPQIDFGHYSRACKYSLQPVLMTQGLAVLSYPRNPRHASSFGKSINFQIRVNTQMGHIGIVITRMVNLLLG
ncbi:uncharacterized protein MYCFIDRAFT_178975 [Pseudocercospora fijiensis CIRAD86]|uniref:Uncharacterized protein n=1 Tax=Pseudocercospora fijiensis (strain CIRAD86) TaxID=383855 RepID=M3A2Y3_PSEFD|nr:uncharacterized protein MYCFIDRAFT_178975 [Pseudocercospora fijiensis CIRAD86]EME78891.1 hypothetical protein MYCFIDRAFT_178975 [Pseudocercospora fijiensis CIRAD86]